MKHFFELCDSGSSRMVFLVGKFAVKIPRITSISEFVAGIIDNKTEFKTSKNIDKNIIPLIYFYFFGVFVIHERANKIKNRGIFIIHLCEICSKQSEHRDFLMLDSKQDNFGIIGDRLVKVDYGRLR